MHTNNTVGKIVFANQLRGVAVLLVVFSHYLGTFWGSRAGVAASIHAPLLAVPTPQIVYDAWFPTLNYGPFGVAIFFLISGFVIPFSLEKLGTVRFAAARALRIFPTYWCGLAVVLAFIWASGRYWGDPLTVGLKQLFSNMLLINAQLGVPSIDDVNWTLSIELKFYIVSMLLWPALRRGSVAAIIYFALGVLAFLSWAPQSWGVVNAFGVPLSLDLTRSELMFIPFLFIGTLFNFAFHGRITIVQLACASAAIVAMMLMSWVKTPLASQFTSTPINYIYALAVFSLCYALRSRFRPVRVINFFAEISYPLYVVHCLSGYVVIRYLIDRGVRGDYAALVAFAIVVAFAYGVHLLVEMPTTEWGKRLARSNRSRQPTAETPSMHPASTYGSSAGHGR